MTLEQKIRNAIPELMELGVGCEIETQTKQRLTIYSIDKGYYNCHNSDVVSTSISKPINPYHKIIGKPIQLNHVLEYVKIILKSKKNSEIAKENIIILNIVYLWNLKSNLFSDQSPELKNFINELA